MPQRGNTAGMARENIRVINTKALLNAIHKAGQVSRTDLSALVGLSQAAVTEITGELLRQGIVYEAREGESTSVGRKPILLQIAYESASVLGVKVANNAVTSVLTNLQTDVLATRVEPLHAHDPETVLDSIERSVQQLKRQATAEMVATAVTLPGLVDTATARVRSPLLGWQDVPFGDLLSERLKVPVLLDNDVNALAAAAASFGPGLTHDSFLVVTLGRGVGLGMVINRHVYRGTAGGAGEFGHVTLNPDGPHCNCGRRGCLEAYLSDAALLDAVRKLLPGAASLDEAAQLPEAAPVFQGAGAILGRGLAILVNIFAPTLILLAGEGMRSREQLLPAAREAMLQHTFAGLGDRVQLEVAAWGDDAWARGAAGMAAVHYLENIASEIGEAVKNRRSRLSGRGGG